MSNVAKANIRLFCMIYKVIIFIGILLFTAQIALTANLAHFSVNSIQFNSIQFNSIQFKLGIVIPFVKHNISLRS